MLRTPPGFLFRLARAARHDDLFRVDSTWEVCQVKMLTRGIKGLGKKGCCELNYSSHVLNTDIWHLL